MPPPATSTTNRATPRTWPARHCRRSSPVGTLLRTSPRIRRLDRSQSLKRDYDPTRPNGMAPLAVRRWDDHRVAEIGSVGGATGRPRYRHPSEVLYGLACWAVFCSLGCVVWPLLLVLPRLSWRWRLVRTYGRAMAKFLAVPLTISGSPPAGESCVYVANHASYLDSFALFVMSPEPVVFAAGTVLSRQRVVGTFLRRIGAAFVGSESRGDLSPVESVLQELQDAIRAGRSVIFFPEGGLTATDELRRFHLGGFLVAVETGCRVVPIGIRGSRAMLPAGSRLPRRGAIRVRRRRAPRARRHRLQSRAPPRRPGSRRGRAAARRWPR